MRKQISEPPSQTRVNLVTFSQRSVNRRLFRTACELHACLPSNRRPGRVYKTSPCRGSGSVPPRGEISAAYHACTFNTGAARSWSSPAVYNGIRASPDALASGRLSPRHILALHHLLNCDGWPDSGHRRRRRPGNLPYVSEGGQKRTRRNAGRLDHVASLDAPQLEFPTGLTAASLRAFPDRCKDSCDRSSRCFNRCSVFRGLKNISLVKARKPSLVAAERKRRLSAGTENRRRPSCALCQCFHEFRASSKRFILSPPLLSNRRM